MDSHLDAQSVAAAISSKIALHNADNCISRRFKRGAAMILKYWLVVALTLLVAVTAQAQVTVDYSSTTTSFGPQLFTLNGSGFTFPLAASQGVGVTTARMDYYIVEIAPTGITLTQYQNALHAGCPSGSLYDPNTWNWTRTNLMQTYRNAGFKVLGIMDTIPAWDSSTGNEDGQIIDYTF